MHETGLSADLRAQLSAQLRSAPVVITRPLAQAQLLAPQVSALGRQAVLFPLLEIVALSDASALRAALAALPMYALVVFVSPNAIDAAFAQIAQWPADVAIGIIGAGSRSALARHGVTDANARIVAPQDDANTDSEGLFAALDVAALRARRVLIVRGQAGRDFLSDALLQHGVMVEHVSAYQRVMPTLDHHASAKLRQLLDCDSVWIVTSSEALRNLLSMLAKDDVVKMQHKYILVPHARIAATAQAAGFSRVILTGSGDARLLAALQSCP